MNFAIIKALKAVGEEIDSLFNASPFHETSIRLTWSQQATNDDFLDEFTRIDFRVFTKQTHPNERQHKKIEDYTLGFEFRWDASVPQPDAYLRFGLYSASGMEATVLPWVPYMDFIDQSAFGVCNRLLGQVAHAPEFQAHLKTYTDAAIDSRWIADVLSAFADQRTMIESCL
ncbi:zinc finger containing protein [Erwinia phage pEa_SNUABM_5]|uniref:Zinc finger containing protein n=1 Tax=Erwinia phage pEa_SNUABM_5 TaxID=2797313 RepID=A0A7T8EQC6_9CAUD|nr:zinc finger containing protein [Erwinia phage pEa_SNUABM_5]QQO90417.1 zinc finger containing protein [Erwinia phage pEa_SNUABM_5]